MKPQIRKEQSVFTTEEEKVLCKELADLLEKHRREIVEEIADTIANHQFAFYLSDYHVEDITPETLEYNVSEHLLMIAKRMKPEVFRDITVGDAEDLVFICFSVVEMNTLLEEIASAVNQKVKRKIEDYVR